MKNKHCEWCDAHFETKISYQIYCSPKCREEATKEKIAQRYDRKRRNSPKHKNRKCKSCDAQLSVYNDEQLCSLCIVNPTEVSKTLRQIKGLANGKDQLDN